MNELYYNMIFKRKSFHIFKDVERKINQEELLIIKDFIKGVKPLIKDIKFDIEIVDQSKTTCKRGQEYCILFYSEKKGNYLQNIGYIGEQIDLYLTSLNIGALWFGIGRPDIMVNSNGLDFVIMIAIAKVSKDKFRKDLFKSKRKITEEIWKGSLYKEIGNIVRFSPSACNSQPWFVEDIDNVINVYRYKKPGKRGIMPIDKVSYYNKIDIGIFMLFLEICLKKQGYIFSKEIYDDNFSNDNDIEKTLNAKYYLK